MNSMTKQPLHLVERAVERLREGSGGGPERALLVDAAIGPAALPRPAGAEAAGVPGPRRLAIATLEGAGMITTREQRDRIAEEFRIVGQQVLAGIAAAEAPGRARHAVMVTSARQGEGKSFAALNLAASLALGGERSIILIDADIGPDSLSNKLGLAAETGLLDLVASPAQLAESALARSRIESLSVLPIGGGADPAGRALISAHHTVAGLVASLARRFDDHLFIVDAPPCLSSSDPAGLAAVVGQTILVVEAEKTRRSEIEAALDLLDACPNIRLLLNKVRLHTHDTFGIHS